MLVTGFIAVIYELGSCDNPSRSAKPAGVARMAPEVARSFHLFRALTRQAGGADECSILCRISIWCRCARLFRHGSSSTLGTRAG
jgi:hypothetical protein